VKVSFYAGMRPIVGAKTVEIPLPEGATVRRLVEEVIERYPPLASMLLDESGEVSRSVHVFVNGRGATYLEEGLATPLSRDDRVDIIPAAAGGREQVRAGSRAQGIPSSRSLDSETTPASQPRAR
jgi:molybdopterin synthase sulfur carrier subunit